jgi:hypothetical protein
MAVTEDLLWRASLHAGSPVQVFCVRDRKWHSGMVIGQGASADQLAVTFVGWEAQWDKYFMRGSEMLRPLNEGPDGWRFALVAGSPVSMRLFGENMVDGRVVKVFHDELTIQYPMPNVDGRLSTVVERLSPSLFSQTAEKKSPPEPGASRVVAPPPAAAAPTAEPAEVAKPMPAPSKPSYATIAAAAAAAAAGGASGGCASGGGASGGAAAGAGETLSRAREAALGNPLVVVAIDLGTSGSGSAYALLSQPKEIHCEQHVSGTSGSGRAGGGGGAMKVPTCVLLRAKDLSFVAFGHEASAQYRAMGHDDEERADYLFFERFKMQLYPKNGAALTSAPLLRAACGRTVPAIRVLTASLAYLKNSALERLKAASLDLLRPADIAWNVTVPAIWSPGAKQLMRDAAIAAGIADPTMVSASANKRFTLSLESEAAAICCRARQMAVGALAAVELVPGASFVAADLGGGTADFTVHKILANGKVAEEAASTGGDWGSTAIDRNFLSLMSTLLGEPLMEQFQRQHPVDMLEFMGDFETLKMTVKRAAPIGGKPHRLRMPLTLLRLCKLDSAKYGQSIPLPITAPIVVVVPPLARPSPAAPPDVAAPGAGSAPPDVAALAAPGAGSAPPASSRDDDDDWEVPEHPNRPAPPQSSPPAAKAAAAVELAAVGAPPPSSSPAAAGELGAAPRVYPPLAAGAAAGGGCASVVVVVAADDVKAKPAIVVSSTGAFCRDGSLYLPHASLLGLFDAPVEAIVAELAKVIKSVPSLTHVFSVGGFSESDVVRTAVDACVKHCEEKEGRKVSVICPPHAGLAVLTGAVMFGLHPGVITSRRVKKTYGVAVSSEWQPKKHADRKKAYRPNNGKMVAFCDGIFSPFCLAGDAIAFDAEVSQMYTPGEDNQESMVLKIFESDDRDVTFSDAANARLVGTMTLQMPELGDQLRRRVQVSMSFGATEIVVSGKDLTSGIELAARLCCLNGSLDAPRWVPPKE